MLVAIGIRAQQANGWGKHYGYLKREDLNTIRVIRGMAM